MDTLRKYGATYALLFRNSLVRDMAFKANFILWIITELLWFFGQIVFVEVMFSQTDRILDWTKWEVVLLIGTHQVISQLFQSFFYVNLANLPELVRTGKARPDAVAAGGRAIQRFGAPVRSRQCGDRICRHGHRRFSLQRLSLVPSAAQWLLYAGAVVLGVSSTTRSCSSWRRRAFGSCARRGSSTATSTSSAWRVIRRESTGARSASSSCGFLRSSSWPMSRPGS